MKSMKVKYLYLPVGLFFITLLIGSIKFHIETPIKLRELDHRVVITELQVKLLPTMANDIKWIKKTLDAMNKEKS